MNECSCACYSAAGSDYETVNEMLIFTPYGETAQCFNISIIDDHVYESSETFLLSISPLDNACLMLTNRTISIDILDNECKPVINVLNVILACLTSYLHFSMKQLTYHKSENFHC